MLSMQSLPSSYANRCFILENAVCSVHIATLHTDASDLVKWRQIIQIGRIRFYIENGSCIANDGDT